MFAALFSLHTLIKKLQTGHEANGDPLFVARGKVWTFPKKLKSKISIFKGQGKREQHFSVCGEDESQVWFGLLALWWRGEKNHETDPSLGTFDIVEIVFQEHEVREYEVLCMKTIVSL